MKENIEWGYLSYKIIINIIIMIVIIKCNFYILLNDIYEYLLINLISYYSGLSLNK